MLKQIISIDGVSQVLRKNIRLSEEQQDKVRSGTVHASGRNNEKH